MTRFRCVAVDMRGYNLSDKPDGISNYHLDLLANDIRQVIEKLGIELGTCLVNHIQGMKGATC